MTAWLLPGLAALAAALVFTGWLQRTFRRRAILATPNERSSHEVPTPVGGGISILAAIVAAVLIWTFESGPPTFAILLVLGLSLVLGAVSWADDIIDLHALVRLLLQAGALIIALTFSVAGPPTDVSALVGSAAGMLLIFLAWVWFINLFNFMDGIDGLAGVETITICSGIVAVSLISGDGQDLVVLASIIGAAAAGFLIWNWHPAKIFMGDVGSVPLGFMIGWLLLRLAEDGQWAAALILPAYYVADATITLLRRAAKGRKVWEAHKEHFYQRAHQSGLSHAQVTLRIAVANMMLVGLAAVAAAGSPWPALGGAALVVVILLYHLGTCGKKPA